MRQPRLAGASAIRPGATPVQGRSVSPAAGISLSPGGNSAAQMFIAVTSPSSTRLTTNSPVSAMARAVSFRVPSERRLKLKATIGGSSASTWKKLIGAALSVPALERVVTSAIGRGVTRAVSRR